jgi:hypothetical protein
MRLCDEAAGIAAIKHARTRAVTAGMARMTFLEPSTRRPDDLQGGDQRRLASPTRSAASARRRRGGATGWPSATRSAALGKLD